MDDDARSPDPADDAAPDALDRPFEAAGAIAAGLEADRVRAVLAARLFDTDAGPLKLGRFRVLERLGAGSMGIVYRAHDPTLDRAIALKVLRSETTAPDARLRLLREAKAMASVRHPNLVTVHEVGEEGPHVFIAMELVGGGTLRDWMEDASRPWRQVITRMLAAARGLAALHEQDLVHRDFKPDNVLVDEGGNILLADFGLARPMRMTSEVAGRRPTGTAAARPGLESLTATGAVAGTPAYMAPEQWDETPADARSDQYSFCAVFFEALYGRRPFEGDTPTALNDARRAGPPRVPERSQGRAPRWLHAAVVRGLASDPSERHASMRALIDELERRLRAPRWRWAALGLLAGGGGLATAVALGGGPDAPGPCDRVGEAVDEVWNEARRTSIEQAFVDSGEPFAATSWTATARRLTDHATALRDERRDACESTLVRGERSAEAFDTQMRCLDRRLADLAALADLMQEAETATVRNAVRAAGQLLPAEGCADIEGLTDLYPVPEDSRTRELWADAREKVVRLKVLSNAGFPKRSAALAQEVAALAEEIRHPPLLAETTYFLGVSASALGDEDAAIEYYEQAFNLSLEANWPLYQAWSALGLVRAKGTGKRELDAGRTWAKTAAAAMKRMGDAPGTLASYHLNLGQLELAARRHDAAREHLEASLAIHGTPDLPLVYGLAEVYGNLGVLASREGRLDEALARYAASLELCEANLGEDHPMVGQIHNNRGAVFFARKEYERAAEAYTLSLRIKEKILPAKHPSLGHGHNNLGEVWALQGRHEDALAAYDRALALWMPLGETHPYVGNAHFRRGESLAALGRPKEAIASLRGSLVGLAAGDPRSRAQARLALAKLLQSDDATKAEATEHARAALEDIPAPDDPLRAEIVAFLGDAAG